MRNLFWKRLLFLSLSVICILGFAMIGNASPSGMLEFPADTTSTYRSLADALTTKGYSADHLPTWIPEDYSIDNIDEDSNSKMHRFSAEYVSERGTLQFRALVTSTNVLSFMEKDPGGYTLLHNDLEIFVYTNQGNYLASWFADDIIFTVRSYTNSPNSFTEQEVLRIIRSIPK